MAEIQMGTPAGTVADACAMSNFDINKLSYITLLGMVFYSVFRNLIKQSINLGFFLFSLVFCYGSLRFGKVSVDFVTL